jgi:hypothetical protein
VAEHERISDMTDINPADDESTSITIEDALEMATISVPDAGRLFFGLARNSAYAAAKAGDFPTIKIGGRVMVPVAPLAKMLGLKSKYSL